MVLTRLSLGLAAAAMILSLGFPLITRGASFASIWGANRAANGLDAPILDADGITRLTGNGGDTNRAAYHVEFYVGPYPDTLGLSGQSVVLDGANAGYVEPTKLNFGPGVVGKTLFIQMRVWESKTEWGVSSYAGAIARGARHAVSEAVPVVVGTLGNPGVPRRWKSVVLGPPRNGTVTFANRAPPGLDAPVYDVDGITRLAGPAYVAQLFARRRDDPAVELLPLGAPVPFGTGASAGYWDPGTNAVLSIDGTIPGQRMVGRVYAWEANRGSNLDAAIRAGSAVGVSHPLDWIAGSDSQPAPTILTNLTSFRLTPPSPGTLDLRDRGPNGGGPRIKDWRGSGDPATFKPLAAPFLAQVLVGHGLADLMPVTDPLPLGTGATAGYWTPPGNGVLTLPGFVRGERALVVLRAWDGSLAATYEGLPKGAIGQRSREGLWVWLRLGGEDFAAPNSIPDHAFNTEAIEHVSIDFRYPERVLTATGEFLADTNFVAQLHETETGHPLGEPAPFAGPTDPGRWRPNPAQPVVVGTRAIWHWSRGFDVRIWDLRHGSTYDSATGGLRTKSKSFLVIQTTIPYEMYPANLGELGLPRYAAPALEVHHAKAPLVLGFDAGTNGLDRPGFVGQLHWLASSTTDPVRFAFGEGGEGIGPVASIGTGAKAGIWEIPESAIVELVGSPASGETHVQLRVWEADRGASYSEAVRNGSRVGRSEAIRLTLSPESLMQAQPLDLAPFRMGERVLVRKASPGLDFLGNPTARSAGPDTARFLRALIENPPAGTTIVAFDAATQSYLPVSHEGTKWVGDASLPASPGQGFFVFNPTGKALTLTFEGWDGALEPLTRPSHRVAFFARANTFDRPASYEEVAGIPPAHGDAVFRFVGGRWQTNAFQSGAWTAGPPTLPADEAWFVRLAPIESPVPQPPSGGTIAFGNLNPAAGLHALVYDASRVNRIESLPVRFQLLAGASIETLRPVGEPLDLSGPGVFGLTVRTVPELDPGQPAVVRVRAWTPLDGPDFTTVEARNGRTALSDPITVILGGDTLGGSQPPTLPADLLGLAPLSVGDPRGNPPRIDRIEVFDGGLRLGWSDRPESWFSVEVTDVLPPRWHYLGEAISTGPAYVFEDRGLPNRPPGPSRFYRIRSP